MFSLTTSIEHCMESSSQCSKSSRGNKTHPNWKRSKTIIYRWLDCLFRKRDAIDRTAERTSEFSKAARYRVNIYNQFYFHVLVLPRN